MALLSLSDLRQLKPREAPESRPVGIPANAETPAYRSIEDIYRERWRWDKVVKGTHLLNCWYQRSCAFNVYVKDGIVLREEQAGEYPQTNPSVPDFNPRGCQKGSCYAIQMYDSGRVLYPLKRAGERGQGLWKRTSWDEALTEIADKVIDTLAHSGAEAVVFDGNPAGVASHAAVHRLANLLDAIVLDVNCEVGDEQQGAAVTFGTPVACRSADDYFHSDLIFIWGGNPGYTQIPNFHFLCEARYRGARIVAISPDFNASAVHADWWVPIRPGSDAALALAMAQVIISRDLYRGDFVREQTDLPLLVRRDTGRLLRESDLKARGREDVFYVYDLVGRKVVRAPRRTLKLRRISAALDGDYELDTPAGRVTVTPVFRLLRERLDADYTPEKAAPICGVHPQTIVRLAEALARAKAASGVAGACLSKYYHGDLMMRAQILVFALCGQMGRKGAGYDSLPFLIIDGTLNLPFARGLGRLDTLRTMAPLLPSFLGMRMKGYSNELATYQLARNLLAFGGVNSVLFWYFHGGLGEVSGRSREWDPYLNRDVDEYIQESERRGWQPMPPATEPRVYFATSCNTLRRVRGAHRLMEELLPGLDLLVSTDVRMSSTALNSDYVLPAAGFYEKCDVTDWYTPLSPFAHITTPAVPPLGEAKPEWEIMALLAKKIDEGAKKRALRAYKGRRGTPRRLTDLYRRMTFGGKLDENQHEGVAETVIGMSNHLEKVDWHEFRSRGFLRFTGLGSHPANFGNATDIAPGQTITPHTWRIEKKVPWPTLTRRIQFYIDHPLYMELGEQLPIHKDPPKAGGDYPLTMTGGHSRHSIHASFRINPLMLELERGQALMYMAPDDAKARGINDGEVVKAYNDIGQFLVHAKISPALRPGQVVLYNAWENYQFPGGIGHRNVIASPINPVELAGDYFHIRPAPAILQPGQNDRETRVEVAKVCAQA